MRPSACGECSSSADGPLTDEVRYHLARSLVALDMPAAAEPYLAAIVKEGPDAKDFEPAVQLLVEIAELFHDLESLEPLALAIPRESMPDTAEPYFLYLQGVHAAETGDLATSRRLLDDVLPPVRPYAKFYQGVVFAKQGKLQSAYGAFLDVHQASGDGRVDAPPDLQDAAIMNVARIYFDVERWEEAKKYYRMIGKRSPYWGEALLESGWTYFLTDQLEPALARVLTVKATPGLWLPEATVLECLIYYSANAFQQAENELFRFENDGNSLHYEMEELLKSAKDRPEVAWDTTFAEADGSDLPPVLRAIVATRSPLPGRARTARADRERTARREGGAPGMEVFGRRGDRGAARARRRRSSDEKAGRACSSSSPVRPRSSTSSWSRPSSSGSRSTKRAARISKSAPPTPCRKSARRASRGRKQGPRGIRSATQRKRARETRALSSRCRKSDQDCASLALYLPLSRRLMVSAISSGEICFGS